MISAEYLRDNLSELEKAMKRRGGRTSYKTAAKLLREFNLLQKEREEIRAERNQAAGARDIELGKATKIKLDDVEGHLNKTYDKLNKIWMAIPNLPMADVPDGGENDGKILETFGEPHNIANPKDHVDLGTALDILDMERGAKVSGNRFYYLKNEAVVLEFALIKYVSDILIRKGFTFLMGPQLLGEKAMLAGGYLGKAKEEVYKTQDDLYLIGTSEQAMLAYHMDEIIDVPKRYTSFSTCFRREAGSYGKDVKGIIRTHQFDKIEMFIYSEPEKSEQEFNLLVETAEEIVRELGIPYRKVLLAAGDLSVASAKTIDIECWLPSQNCYRETHSISNCTDWQSRGAHIRYKSGDENKFVHTLNGTALAIGRFLAVLLENCQRADGSVEIPAVLQSYLRFKEIKK